MHAKTKRFGNGKKKRLFREANLFRFAVYMTRAVPVARRRASPLFARAR